MSGTAGGDVAILFDPAAARGDWSLVASDIARGPAIVSAVLLSLFTDARCPDDVVPPVGRDDRRGWWGSTYTGRPAGSTLWLYERASKSGATNLPVAIRRACEAALQWLLDQGVASSIKVSTAWSSPDRIGIRIVVAEPSNTPPTTFDLSWAWNGT